MPASLKWLIVVLLAALPVMLVLGNSLRDIVDAPPPTKDDAIHISKLLMKQIIRAPATAIFPADDVYRVEELGHRHFRVKGYVDTVNAHKKSVRIPYSVEFERHGDRWKMIRYAAD